MRFIAVLFIALLLLPALAYADALEDAKAAYSRQDYPTALKLLQPLADQGNAVAQTIMGMVYDNNKDYAEAVKWYRKAADQGDAESQQFLAYCYSHGNGVQQDYVQAYMWHVISAQALSGSDKDLDTAVLDSLAKKMTPEQIAEAKKLAAEWKPTPSKQ